MTQPSVAAEVHQPLNIHRHLAPQVALDYVVAIDDFANLQHFLIGQLRYPAGFRDTNFLHDFIGLFRPDAMDILQCNNNPFVGRYIDAGDAGHSHSLLLPAPIARPALIPHQGGSQTITRHPPRSAGARYRSTSQLGCGLLMDSTSFRQPPAGAAFAPDRLAASAFAAGRFGRCALYRLARFGSPRLRGTAA